jgi:hypothetical protein
VQEHDRDAPRVAALDVADIERRRLDAVLHLGSLPVAAVPCRLD